MRTKKGQFTLIGIIMVVLGLIVLSALMPVIKPLIENIQSQSDPTTAVVVGLIPFFLYVGLILGILWYSSPPRQQ